MKKIVLFYNPVSGHAAIKNKLDMLVEEFQRRQMLLLPYRTQAGGNERLVAFLQEIRPEGLIAAGGDGTVHEAANLLIKSGLSIPLGIIGCGTSNDFATYLDINTNLEEYFDRIAAGKTCFTDLGRIGDDYFINVASAGMMTSIAHEVPPRLKNSLGKLAYYLKGIEELPRFRSLPLTVTADGNEHKLDAFFFLIINSPMVASMKHVGNGIEINDGKLDFLAVKKCSPVQMMSIAKALLSGKPVAEKDSVMHLQAREFMVSTEEEVISDIDGEAGPMLPLHVETVPQALKLFI